MSYIPFGGVTPVTRVFFVTTVTPYGSELWMTDGTQAGTVPIDGTRLGSGGSDPQNLTVIGSKLFYTADNGDGGAGRELYEFDPSLRDWRFGTGAQDAIKRRANIAAGNTSSNPTFMTVLGGQLYFRAQTSTTGGSENFEIYRWDPAIPATAPAAITNFTSNTVVIANLTVVGTDKLFFTADDTTAAILIGNELYCYNVTGTGLAAGTLTPLDVLAGGGSSNPLSLVSFDPDGSGAGAAKLFFQAARGAVAPLDQELFSSDGTVGGTGLFLDILTGTGASLPQSLFVHTLSTTGNPQVLYFSAANTGTDQELWKSDGTVGGTARLKDIRSGATGSAPTNFFALGDTVLFSANDGTTGIEPWKTDGTLAGTVLLSNINTTTANSSPTRFTLVGSQAFFRATGPSVGIEVYKTDGITTTLVKDILTGTGNSDPGTTAADQPQMIGLGTQAILAASDGTTVGTGSGIELWGSDGTGAGTTLLKDTNVPGDSEPRRFVRMGDKMYLTATHPANGHELYQSDGTPAGTLDISNATLRLGGSSADPAWLTIYNNKLYFTADTGTSGGTAPNNNTGRELWVLDPAGTNNGATAHDERMTLVSDINVGTGNSSPTQLTVFNNKLYFAASTTALGYELYVYDGVSAPVRATTSELRSAAADPGISNLFVFGDYLYFTATDGVDGTELYRLHKTGTDFERFNLSSGSAVANSSSTPSRFCTVSMVGGPYSGQDVMYFVASDGAVGEELWFIDPADNLPKMLKNINTTTEVAVSAARSSAPRNMIAFKGKLFFDASTSDTTTENRELYSSDGSVANTGLHLGVEINSVAGASSMDGGSNMSISSDGNWLYIRATKGDSASTELYRTDGSTPVALVADVNPTSASGSTPVNIFSVPDSVYVMFNADTGSGATTGVVNTNGGQNTGREWWVTDGTAAGTQIIADINPNTVPLDPGMTVRYSCDPNNAFDVNDSRINLTLLSGNGGSIPSAAAVNLFEGPGGKLYFRAVNNVTGRELYVMGGAPAPLAYTTGVDNQITTATFQGRIDRQGAKASYYFEWGTTTGYGNVTPTVDVSGGAIPTTSTDAVPLLVTSSLPAASLTAGTQYHFRLVAVSRYGTSFGDDYSFITSPAEIAVEDGSAVNLVSAGAPVSFGNVLAGARVSQVFTIRNTGAGTLSVPAVSGLGGDFSVNTTGMQTSLSAGGSTTFSVVFSPTAGGASSGTLQIQNNDSDENPFVINFTGTGITNLTAAFNNADDVPLTVDGLNANPLTVNLGLNFAPTPGSNLTVVKNTGPGLIQGTFDQGDSTDLENGETVMLTFGGTSYPFVAWYFGGIGGNDLVLLWKHTGLAAWGANSDGRLGLGNEFSQSAPQPVNQGGLLLGKTIVQVATGTNHTLVLDTDGKVYAWGLNSSGQLGDNTIATKSSAVAVNTAGVLAGKVVKAIAAGATHSFALTTDGKIYAWGRFNEGQLGQAVLPGANSLVPIEVDTTTSALAGKTVTTIAAGANFGLALASTGEVYGWGQNGSGQLGDGSATNRNSPVATDVTSSVLAGKTVVAIAAGTSHSIALTSEGLLYAWGAGSSGQLGNGLLIQVNRPIAVETNSSSALMGKMVVDVQAGNSHNSAIDSNGVVYAWGGNPNGQVGDNSIINALLPEAVVATGASSLTGKLMTKVHAVGSHTVAVDSTGAAHAWGLGTSGQLGNLGLTDSLLPQSVSVAGSSPLAGRKVSEIAVAGGNPVHTVVIYGGTAQEIDVQQPAGASLADGGAVNFGPIMTGATGRKTFVVRNLGVAVLTGISVNVDGTDAARFTLDTAGMLTSLQVGQSTTFDVIFQPLAAAASYDADLHVLSNDSDEASFDVDLLGSGAASLTATFNSASDIGATVGSLTATGTSLNLGLGFVPQPGTGLTVVNNVGRGFINGLFTQPDTTTLANGETVPLTFGGVTYNFVAWYYGGDGNDLVLLWKDTNLAAWGAAGNGRLGNAQTTPNRLLPVAVTRSGVLAGKTIVSVAIGSSFTLALDTDGKVYAWGQNNTNQLGDGSTTERTSPVAVDVSASSSLNGKVVVAIAAGSAHSLALTSDGKVHAWGTAASGALGDNQSTTNRARPVLVTDTGLLSGKTITAISAGTSFSLALDSDGKVYSWGLATNGVLGDNQTATNRVVAVAVDTTTALGTVPNPLNGKRVVAIAAGTTHAMALTSDNILCGWGLNSNGQLGDGTTTSSRNVPSTMDVGSQSALNGKTVRSLVTGSAYGMVHDSDGIAYAWGLQTNGRLGNNLVTATNRVRAILVDAGATSALNGKTVKAVASGTNHSFALTSDNRLAAWGLNSSGQVGINSATADIGLPTNVDVSSTSELRDRQIIGIGRGPTATHSVAIYASAPEIVVEHPVATSLTDGVSEIDFGDVTVGQTATAKTFTVRNDGTGTLTGLVLSKSGANSGSFTLGSLGATTLAAGASTTFTVNFAPVVGGNLTATVSLASNDFDESSFDILVKGRGMAPEITVTESATNLTTPASLNFGTVSTTSSSSKTVTIANTGNVTLSGVAVSRSGSANYSLDTTGLLTSLLPGETTSFMVIFTPTTTGASIVGSVSIASNDADENPFVINLTGQGAPPPLGPVPSPFGDVVSTAAAPDGMGTGSVGNFDVLRRGGFIAENGHVVFPSSLVIGSGSPAVTAGDSQGIWKDDGFGLFLLARTGYMAPGTAGAVFDTLPQVPAINDADNVTILASLRIGVGDAVVTNDTGIWSEIGGSGLELLLREGEVITAGNFVDKFASGAYATARTGATSGEAAFSISLRGASTNTAIVRVSVSGSTRTPSVVALQTQAAPGLAGFTFGVLNGAYSDPARMDATGNLSFTALLNPGNRESLWYQPQGGSLVKVFAGNEAAPGTTSTFSKIQPPAMGSGGVISFRATLNLDGDNTGNLRNDGIWRGVATNPAGFACILRRGDSGIVGLPVGSKVGNPWGGWLTNNNRGAWRAWIDVNGDGSLASRTTNDVHALFADTNGTMTMVIKEGDAAPGVAGAVIQGFDHPVVGGQDQMAFLGMIKQGGTVTAANDQGLWKQAPGGGALALVLRKGQTITTSAGAKTIVSIDLPGSGTSLSQRRWEQPVMDQNGTMLVYVTFGDGSTSQILVP